MKLEPYLAKLHEMIFTMHVRKARLLQLENKLLGGLLGWAHQSSPSAPSTLISAWPWHIVDNINYALQDLFLNIMKYHPHECIHSMVVYPNPQSYT